MDYTDLFALMVLPIGYKFDSVKYKKNIFIKINPLFVMGLSIFAFASTSAYTEIDVDKKYNFKLPLDSLEHKVIELDELKNYYYRSSSDSLISSMIKLDISINEDFCFDGYNALITISGDSLVSELWLESFNHHCPKDGADFFKSPDQNDLEILTKSFEKKVISNIK